MVKCLLLTRMPYRRGEGVVRSLPACADRLSAPFWWPGNLYLGKYVFMYVGPSDLRTTHAYRYMKPVFAFTRRRQLKTVGCPTTRRDTHARTYTAPYCSRPWISLHMRSLCHLVAIYLHGHARVASFSNADKNLCEP